VGRQSKPHLAAVSGCWGYGVSASAARPGRRAAQADTTKARAKLPFTEKDAWLVNVLIYPVSDDACHNFKGDLASFNHKIAALTFRTLRQPCL
jgi:hypothetical protein